MALPGVSIVAIESWLVSDDRRWRFYVRLPALLRSACKAHSIVFGYGLRWRTATFAERVCWVIASMLPLIVGLFFWGSYGFS